MKDLAIAISVYDKFEDVAILTEIIRENWGGDYYIVVCSSHPEAASRLSQYPLDAILSIDNIPFDPKATPQQRQGLFTLRVIDSIRKSCGHCCQYSHAPYTIHLHADALPLSLSKLKKLAEEMKSLGKFFAARGYGYVHYTHDGPLGEFDDMFFMIDNLFALKSNFWNFELPDILPHKISMHGFLGLWTLMRIGASRVHHYSDYGEATYWDDKPIHFTPDTGYSSRPMYLDPNYDFLHIHTQDFPNDLGPQLKAYYLLKYGLIKGFTIQKFLKRWETDPENLFQDLDKSLESFYHFFRNKMLLFSEEKYGRDFARIIPIVKSYESSNMIGKMKWLVRMHRSQFARILRPLKTSLFSRCFNNLYGDTVWPQSLNKKYQDLFGPYLKEVREFHDVFFDAISYKEK